MVNLLLNGHNWNFEAYDATTNPYGLGGDGHRRTVAGNLFRNFLQILYDLAQDTINHARTTSSTSVAIGTGLKTFTVAAWRGFAEGEDVKIYSTADPTNAMWGTVHSTSNESTLQLVLNVYKISGSGTIASWRTVAAGGQGAQGNPGTGDMEASVYDAANIAQQVVGTTATQTVTNKTLQTGTLTAFNDVWSVQFQSTPQDGTYPWSLAHAFDETLVELYAECSSGSFTVDLKINGVTTATVSPSAGGATDTTFVDATVSAGDDVTFTISSASSAEDAVIRLKTKRNVTLG